MEIGLTSRRSKESLDTIEITTERNRIFSSRDYNLGAKERKRLTKVRVVSISSSGNMPTPYPVTFMISIITSCKKRKGGRDSSLEFIFGLVMSLSSSVRVSIIHSCSIAVMGAHKKNQGRSQLVKARNGTIDKIPTPA